MGSLPTDATTCEVKPEPTEYWDGTQIDQDVCSKIIQELASKVREVLTNPAVIQEIAQHEANTRSPRVRSSAQDPGLHSDEQRLNRPEKYNTPDLKAANQRRDRIIDENNNENDDHEEFLSCSSNISSKNNLSKLDKHLKRQKRKRVAIVFIITAVILLVTILASSLTLFIVWQVMNSGNILMFGSILSTLQLSNEVIQVSVGSSDEYNAVLRNSNKSKLAVNIGLERPGDWPTGTYIQISDNVNSIRIHGKFHTKKLISLLDTVSSLEKLELVNLDNHICTESTEPLRLFDKRNRVSISLKYLSLEHFKSLVCVDALSLLYENIEYTHLEGISIKNGEINHANVGLLENILFKYRKGLKRLEITNTFFEAGLFYNKHVSHFDNVKVVVLESSIVKNTTTFYNPIENLCSIFPNVESFSFGMTPKQYNELLDLSDCKKLKSLQIRIWISYSNTNFSLSFLLGKFINLESADLTLSFGNNFPDIDEKCRDSFMWVGGKKDLPKLLLANIRLASNCRLKFED